MLRSLPHWHLVKDGAKCLKHTYVCLISAYFQEDRGLPILMIDSLHSALLASLHKPLRLNLALLHDLPSPNPRCCSSATMPLAQPCSLLQPLYCIIRAHPGPQCVSGQLAERDGVRRQFTIQLEGTASACLLGTTAAVSRIRYSSPYGPLGCHQLDLVRPV